MTKYHLHSFFDFFPFLYFDFFAGNVYWAHATEKKLGKVRPLAMTKKAYFEE